MLALLNSFSRVRSFVFSFFLFFLYRYDLYCIHFHSSIRRHTDTLTQNDGRSWVMTKLWVSKRTAVKTSFFANQKIRRMRCMQFAHYFSFFQSYHKFLLTSFYYCTPSSPYLLILLLNTYTIFFKTENFILNHNSKLYLILLSVLVKSNNWIIRFTVCSCERFWDRTHLFPRLKDTRSCTSAENEWMNQSSN